MQLAFNFLLCVKNVDIFLLLIIKSSKTTKLTYFLSVSEKFISLIQI